MPACAHVLQEAVQGVLPFYTARPVRAKHSVRAGRGCGCGMGFIKTTSLVT